MVIGSINSKKKKKKKEKVGPTFLISSEKIIYVPNVLDIS